MNGMNSAFATKYASSSAAEARLKVVRLFRAALREASSMIRNYNLDLTRSEMRERIKAEFSKYSHVTDMRVVDMLVFKGTSELEETKLLWKTKSHVTRFFNPERAGRSPQEMKRIHAYQEKDRLKQEALTPTSALPSKSIPQMFWADKHSSSAL